MGETDKDAQGNPLVTGQSPGAGAGSTPEPETPTLTEAQAKAQTAKEVQAALTAAGRTAKQLEQKEAANKAQEAELDARQKALDDAELEAVKGDPDLETQYRNKKKLQDAQKALAEDKRKFEQEKTQHQADIDAANATKKEITIWEIAQKHGVDANALKELNLETPEQIEAVAKAMATGKPATPPGGEPPSEPDSLKTKGGGEDLSGMSSRQAFGSYLSDKKKK